MDLDLAWKCRATLPDPSVPGASGAGELRRLARRLDPPRQILLRSRRERALAREPALRPGRRLPASSARGSTIGGNRPKLTFIGWNERGPASIDSMWPPVMWFEERADRGRRRRGVEVASEPLGGGEAAGDQADRGALDIAFAAGDLAGEAQARARLEPQAARRAGGAN